jgi:hypothetical protein
VTDLERRYRMLLLAYPRRYRTERGEELLATLMDAAVPTRRQPSLAEVGDLLWHATKLRLGVGGARPPRGLLAMTAGAGLSLSAALSLVALLFGELPVWGPDPGLNANQFGYGPFETTGIYAYGLVLAAWFCYVAGRSRASRLLAAMGALAALGSYVCADSLRSRPNVTVLATLVVCLVPLILTQDLPSRPRAAVAAVPVAAVLLGVAAFAALPTGHPNHWDPRDRFYTDRLGLVGRLHPVVPLLALVVLAVAAAMAVRLRRRELWSASTLVLAPALLIALGGGPAGGGIQDRAQGNVPFVEMTAVIVAVGLAEAVMARRRRRASDSQPNVQTAPNSGRR